jgi:predicted RNA-binding protein associated with RNAse of E/G family
MFDSGRATVGSGDGSVKTGTRRYRRHVQRPWSAGQAAVIREVWKGTVFAARPCIVVDDRSEQRTLYVPLDAPCAVAVDEHGDELRLPIGKWRHSIVPSALSALSFAWPDTPYAVLLRWARDGFPSDWYVNLQAPLERTLIGFDTVDHALDVVVAIDGSTWSWKDEEELARAEEMGMFTRREARWFRWWGERAVEHIVLRQPPFDLDWHAWRPDPTWPLPPLPRGWDAGPSR